MTAGPMRKEEKSGPKAWCACGETENSPYCDGTHARLSGGKTPVRVTLDKDQTVMWCGCKKTSNAPFCDGSHRK